MPVMSHVYHHRRIRTTVTPSGSCDRKETRTRCQQDFYSWRTMPAPFKVQSFIGGEIAEFKGGKQPFATAQLVAKVLWSWSPAHSRSADYFVSGNRRGWTLWEVGRDDDTGRRMFAQVAYGWPRESATAKTLQNNSCLLRGVTNVSGTRTCEIPMWWKEAYWLKPN